MAFISAVPALGLLAATAAAGYITVKLMPLVAGQDNLRLSLTTFLMSFIPILTCIIITIVLIAGFTCLLYRESLFILAIGGMIAAKCLLQRYHLEILWPVPVSRWFWLLPAALILIAGVSIFLPFTPAQWDVMTYHLYVPVRWLQAGRIIHVPTFYGDEAAAFAPGNAAALYAWIVALLDNDTLITVFSVVFLLFSGLIVSIVTQKYSGSCTLSYLTAAFAVSAPVVFFKAFSGYTDLLAQSLLLAGLWWALEYLDNQDQKNSYAAIYSALCLGLAIGTKTVMLPMAFPVILFLLIIGVNRRDWKNLLISVIIIAAAGGWWYFRNWWFYGNPLFPAHLKLFGVVFFNGLYDYSILMNGAGHLSSWRDIAVGFYAEYGMAASLLLLLGAAGWLAGIICERAGRLQLAVILALIIFWSILFCKVIPYNDQFRFLIGVWLLSLPGCAILFKLLPKHWLRISISVLIMLWLLFQDGFVLLSLPDGIPLFLPLLFAVGLTSCAVALLICLFRHSTTWLYISGILLAVVIMLAESESGKLRIMTMSKSNLGAFQQIFAPFNQPYSSSLVIACSGLNIPYILTGPHIRNLVFFCNLSGKLSDNSYDFWNRNQREVFTFNGVKFYQREPSIRSWLENLKNAGAQMLVTMRMHPAEYNFHYHDADGFPLESAWAEKLPKIFSPLVKDKLGKVYLIDSVELKKFLDNAAPK